MTSGCAMICSPWKPNSITRVVSSATSDTGCSRVEQPLERGRPAAGEHLAPDDLRQDDGDDDVEPDRDQQGLPGHRDRRESQEQADDRREGEHHDGVVQRDLAQREVRLAVGQVAPDEDHRRAGGGGEQDETGDVAVDLRGREVGPEQPADEQPAQQRHRERLDGPVDEQRHADPAPVLPDPAERGEVDLHQHRDDHEPDQHGHRQVDLGDLRRSDRVEHGRQRVTERDAHDDAEPDPEGQVTLERGHSRPPGRPGPLEGLGGRQEVA